jgi:hypothetical protein
LHNVAKHTPVCGIVAELEFAPERRKRQLGLTLAKTENEHRRSVIFGAAEHDLPKAMKGVMLKLAVRRDAWLLPLSMRDSTLIYGTV